MSSESNPRGRQRSPSRPLSVSRRASIGIGLGLLAASVALAALPETDTLLADVGLSSEEIDEIKSGKLVRHSVKGSSEREITTGIAFQIPVRTSDLLKDVEANLFDQVDPSMIAHGTFSNPPTVADLAKLDLPLDQVRAYASAEPGGDLNLSMAEIETFKKLGKDAPQSALQKAVNEALVARVKAYQAKGLAALEPYALSRDSERSPGTELRNATKASVHLEKYAPEAYAYLLNYPNDQPGGTREAFRWSYFTAHGVPTVVLTHLVLVPDGDAWLLSKRQYYVSSGYNTVQEIGAFLPVENGTIVLYANHTSTDQVTGFGGGAKRSIGSKLLASQIEALFEKASKAAEKK